MANFNTGPMSLIYRDEKGNLHAQPWGDIVQAGTLIDPDTGDDMEIVGWEAN